MTNLFCFIKYNGQNWLMLDSVGALASWWESWSLRWIHIIMWQLSFLQDLTFFARVLQRTPMISNLVWDNSTQAHFSEGWTIPSGLPWGWVSLGYSTISVSCQSYNISWFGDNEGMHRTAFYFPFCEGAFCCMLGKSQKNSLPHFTRRVSVRWTLNSSCMHWT